MTAEDHSWTLVDQYESMVDMEDVQRVPIESVDQLAEKLEKSVKGPPRLLILSSSKGMRIFVGVGGEFAGVLYYDNPDFIDGRYAVPEELKTVASVDFISEESPTTFPAEALMSPKDAIEIVSEFVASGQAPEFATWRLAREII